MAHIVRHGRRWRAQVARRGVRDSAVFDTKAAAEAWAAKEEAAILATKRGLWPRKTLQDAFDRYGKEVSPGKARGRAEGLRMAFHGRLYPELAVKILSEVTTADIAAWRDAELRRVTPGTVERDLRLISNVFTVARDEWKWCGESPLKGLRRPGENPARERRVLPSEVRRICRWLGYGPAYSVRTKYQQVALAFLIGLQTAMRAGEILQVERSAARVAVIGRHKTLRLTQRPREVPLFPAGVRLIRHIPAGGWTITSKSLDAVFRKATASLLIEDLHFHDSRAEALTRFSRRVDVMTLARISGHKDLNLLLERYYRETPGQIAARLGRGPSASPRRDPSGAGADSR